MRTIWPEEAYHLATSTRKESNMPTIHLPAPATCSECGFTTDDTNLLANHSCDVQEQGNRCEDYPCCGHEAGDCNGLLYGSDEAIKQAVYDRWANPDIDPMDPMYDDIGW